MKICQATNVGFGMRHFLVPLMHRLAGLNHEVVGICADDAFVEGVREEGFRVEHVSFDRSYRIDRHVRAFFEVSTLLARERFDIVHVHTPIVALIVRLAARMRGVPTIVYTAHGFYFHEHQPLPVRAFFIALEWIGGRATDVLFTQSQEDAETAKRFRLCRTGRIMAIGNGVSTDDFYPSDNDVARTRMRESLGASKDDAVILMVGRMVAEKGYPELFEAMRSTDAHLWVVGERLSSEHGGSIDNALARLSADPAMTRRVRLLGYRSDVGDLMRAADIFTLPSHREGMPRSIIEAMMCGLPVVATDVRGSREEVVDGETGFLVPVADPLALGAKLAALANDGPLRRRMGAAGLERATALFRESVVIDHQLDALDLTR